MKTLISPTLIPGILAMVAKKLGGDHVVGVDIDLGKEPLQTATRLLWQRPDPVDEHIDCRPASRDAVASKQVPQWLALPGG